MYIQNETIVTIESDSIKSFKKLPSNVFRVKFNSQTGEYYLEKMADFILPTKMYGDIDEDAKRILNTFKLKNSNMGVLLSGLKGAGKSLTAKTVCVKSNLPVIVITEAYFNNEFKSFLSSIKDKCIILYDEFEKVYSRVNQQHLLSVLDGIEVSTKLSLFTVNNDDLNENLVNRPGRIHYALYYNGLSKKVLKEIIKDKLVDKTRSETLLQSCLTLGKVSMDVIMGLIFEMNAYNISTKEALEWLNIEAEREPYTCKVFKKSGKYLGEQYVNRHPLQAHQIETYKNHELVFSEHISAKDFKANSKNGVITLTNDKFKLIYTKVKFKHYSF